MARITGAVFIHAGNDKEQAMSNHINPGPKPVRDDGKDDQRHHVNPPTAPKHPTLPIHNPPKKK